jgi:hypothetical protein
VGCGWEAWVDNNRIKCGKAISCLALSLSLFSNCSFPAGSRSWALLLLVEGLRGPLDRRDGTKGEHKTRWRAGLAPSGVSVMFKRAVGHSLPLVAVKVAWSVQTLTLRTRGLEVRLVRMFGM